MPPSSPNHISLTMSNTLFDAVYNAFGEALFEFVRAAIISGLLFWGVFMGKFLIIDMFDLKEKWVRAIGLSLAVAFLVSAFFGYWAFELPTFPGETPNEAFQDGALVFFYVFLTLSSGFVWGLFSWINQKSEGKKS